MGKDWFDNEITLGIMEKKYLHEGETDFLDLVSRVCSIYNEDIREEAMMALINADLCPAGRVLAGAGLKGKQNVSISNCYILENVEDSLESISAVDLEMSIIGSRGGGVGVSLDKIRPKGTAINNSAKESDGVAFVMRKFNQTGNSIGQNNRHK